MRSLALSRVFVGVVLLPLTCFGDPPRLQNTPEAAQLYSLAQREAQYQKLLGIADAVVEYGRFGRIRQLEGHTGIFLSAVGKLKQGDSAADLFHKRQPILLASGSESLVVRQVVPAPRIGHYVFTDQVIDGVPVIDARVNLIVDTQGEILMVNSLFVPRGNASRTPKHPLQFAKAKLEQTLVDSEMADAESIHLGMEGSLAFWSEEGKEQTPRLLWMIEANFTQRGQPQVVRFGVDAATGDIRHSQQMLFGLNRTVYTNAYRTSLTTPTGGNFLWGEGYPNSADTQAFNIYERILGPIQAWAGTPFAYDTLGLVAHYGATTESWFMYGTDLKPYLFFGDQRSVDDDVIAHEYGHGLFVGHVPGQPSAFQLWDEYFAGNEFYADLSSAMTDIWRRGGNANWYETWTISNVRDWRYPTNIGSHKDWYPDRWFASVLNGVGYSNSTIFGHAVYLMINGGFHSRAGASWPSVLVGGPIPWIDVPRSDPSHIKQILAYGLWRLALYNHKFNGPNFRDHTVAAAYELYGPAAVADTVDKAWQAVGIRHACSAAPPVPSYSIEPYFCRGGHRITWPAMPGVKYHGEVVKAGLPWDMAQTAFDVARSDVGTTSCTQNVTTTVKFHMRACNGCGCSDWSPADTMQYYKICL